MKERTRIFRFMLIGTLNALITALMVWISMGMLGLNYLYANIVAYGVAQTHNFLWSKFWIFPMDAAMQAASVPPPSTTKSNTCRQVLLFVVAFLLAYLGQFLFLVVMVEWVSLNEYLAQFFGLFVYGTVNFLMNRRITFKG